MPLSYKVIKNHQVSLGDEDFKIPTTITKGFSQSHNEKSSYDEENKESIQKAGEIIQQAKKQAKLILDGANKEAQNIQVRAQSEGYEQGFKKGQEEGHSLGYSKGVEETEKMKAQAKSLLNNAHVESRKYIRKTKEEIINLSLSIAKNIIVYSIDNNNEIITEIAKNALEKSENSKQIIFRSPSKYLALLKNNVEEFIKICPNASYVFLEDNEVEDRSCIIETDTQIMDLQLDLQLKNIRTALLEMRKEDEF